MGSKKVTRRVPKKKMVKKKPKKMKKPGRSRSTERKERVKQANVMAKRHKQKLLDAKLSRQRQRNRQMLRMHRKLQMKVKTKAGSEKQLQEEDGETDEASLDADEIQLIEQHIKEESFYRRFMMRVEDMLARLLYFLTVTLRSERTFDWLVFLANNLGLFQEYEINDYGQRLSPRTGNPVLLSLGPLRVVQVVESANQVRSHWDPYIREYLRESKLTTDCWRANRMALQVALCMDESGKMFDMPIHESAMRTRQSPSEISDDVLLEP